VASTAAADALIAASKRRQLLAFLQALDAFHADEQRIEAGVDPATGAALPPSQVPQAISAATARLAEAFHAAIDLGWQEAFTAGMQEMHGGVAPSRKAQRVLQAEAAAQKAYATRFASDVAEGVPTQPGRWSEGRRTAAYAEATGAAFQIAGALGGPPGELIWWRLGEVVNHCAECPIIAANSPYTQESIPTAPRAGATPCRAACKCYLTTSPPTTPPKSTAIDQNAAVATDTQFEDRVFLPPPVPPGLRLPTADERGVLRDLEIRRNEARRRAYAAAMDGDKELASVWRRQSRDLTGEIMTYAEDRQIHHVPTFRVSDVVTGKDIGRRDIDRLTHIRGLDGVTVSRAHAQAVLDAVNAAKRNLLADLETYPDVGGFTRESWRDALKAAGAPPSAFGGDLYRLGTEATCCGEADCGRCQSRLSPVARADESECRCARGTHAHRPAARHPAGAVLATEASTPTVQASTLPDPEDWRIVNVVSSGARATLRNHVAALETLAASKKRGGPAAYDVSVGPFAEGWSDLVASGGTWVQGPLAELERFFADWAKRAPDPIVAATWQPM